MPTNDVPQQEVQDISEILRIRRDKLAELKAAGQDPYAITSYSRTHSSTEILDRFEELEGKEVSVAGRIMSKRIMGKASFFHVADGEGNNGVNGDTDSK